MNQEFLVGASSLYCADFVPAPCTHRPSLLPIERFGEEAGLGFFGVSFVNPVDSFHKAFEPDRLEEGEVVTR